jgi:DNA (cytosine-5)-methyltransferase 1
MKYTLLETFVGAGGSHLGFVQNGFKSIFVNDISENCLKTLTFNNPELKSKCIVNNQDITEIKPKDILNQTNLNIGDLDVMFGGIVCKGFSLAGERSPNDPRNTYYRYQLNLVKHLKPKISIIENVPGILNAMIINRNVPLAYREKVDVLWKDLENLKGRLANNRKLGINDPNLIEYSKNLRNKKDLLIKELIEKKYLLSVKEDITKIYLEIGYQIFSKVLNSASFGSFTKRDRVIIVAVRNDINIPFEFPKPSISNPVNYKTVGEALNQIKTDPNDLDNVPMDHNEKTIKRMAFLKPGENFSEIMYKLPIELKISKFYSRGSTYRLDPKKTAPTLVPGHSNFPIHPFENRSITVREAALITGFPINYKFFGSHTKRCEQVGNAVPPPLSFAIAKKAKDLLNIYYSKIKKVS